MGARIATRAEWLSKLDDQTAGLPGKTISEEFPEWHIEASIGWTATRYSNGGATIHTVGAPTVHELRRKLTEIRARPARR